MKFDLAIPHESAQARVYFMRLLKSNSLVEIKRFSLQRTLKQNSYLYLLLSAFGEHFGYTLEEAKQIYKQEINPVLFMYQKGDYVFWRSSADLTIEQMTESIESLRDYSESLDYPLPTPDNGPWLRQLENAIEQSKKYL
jgi:hypothetical protein